MLVGDKVISYNLFIFLYITIYRLKFMLQRNRGDQLNRSREKESSITKSQGREEHSTKKKPLDWSNIA
jgi:hypothetical protein